MARNEFLLSFILFLFLILVACTSADKVQKITERQNNISFNQQSCTIDEDCKVNYGCECGCYNKEYQPIKDDTRECKCQAPNSCKCVANLCKNAR